MGYESRSRRDKTITVDREQVCPFLLRLFLSNTRHSDLERYSRHEFPKNELQIYTWHDATLKELSALIREVNEDSRKKGTVLEFSSVYADNFKPTFRMRTIGSTCVAKPSNEDNVTLGSKHFVIGDYIDVAIISPRGSRRYS
ncbi:Sin3-associated polypeptide [Intoshia linei]|uniref:18 kDa Sin3-associated polypeptide n=1 Tax=Intoshia linei TaxID=1819745 RepID=A0A177B802_9BILA|nr:Sin3-associated polypeptide [Intoshia linei]